MTSLLPKWGGGRGVWTEGAPHDQEGDKIILDNQGVVKATPAPWKGTVKDQEYEDIGYNSATMKHLTVRWTHGHRELQQASKNQDYRDTVGNDHPDCLANPRYNLPANDPPPQPHDIPPPPPCASTALSKHEDPV